MKSSINNPFVSCTARDMSYTDVERYWCSPFDCYRIREEVLTHAKTPVIIEGARGSGKTMILKHMSFFCKKERYSEGSYLKSIEEDGFLGIYFRYSADYGSLFEAINCGINIRSLLFENYFQLCMSIELSRILQSIENELSNSELSDLLSALETIVGVKISSISELTKLLESRVAAQDSFIRKSKYNLVNYSDINENDKLFFHLLSIVKDSIICLRNVLFLLIIDEYENVGFFQTIINTYIKQLEDANYSFRIGVRPEGIVNYGTNLGNEFLQAERDFILYRLIIDSNDRSSKYRRFVESVINRRLNSIPEFSWKKVTIEKLLGRTENYSIEATELLKGKHLNYREFLSNKTLSADDMKAFESDDPLDEAYFVMVFNRGKSLDYILELKKDLLNRNNTQRTAKYHLDMGSKYKAALLFWIVDRCHARKKYYSFDTFLYLSCGSIYDFIGLCRYLFDELGSNIMNQIESQSPIDSLIQTTAARKYAESQLEKVRINHEHGTYMWHFVQNMCGLFSFFHKGDLCTKYPETNQFYISGTFDSSGVNKEIWKSLIKWGIVVKKSSHQRASLGASQKVLLYYVSKVFYPLYNISCRIRGGYNFALNDFVWDNMITTVIDPSSLVKTKGEKKPVVIQNEDDGGQLSLF